MESLIIRPVSLPPSLHWASQHHDAVSGTEKQHVAYDYASRIARGRLTAEVGVASALANLTRTAPGTAFATCDLANATICPALEAGAAAAVVVYNSRGQAAPAAGVRLPVGLPAGVASYTVTDAAGRAVPAQLVPASPADEALRTGYYGYEGSGVAVAWLAFQVRASVGVPPFLARPAYAAAPSQAALPAMGFSTFFIEPSASAPPLASPPAPVSPSLAAPIVVSNGAIALSFDPATGLASQWTDLATQASTPFTQVWRRGACSRGAPGGCPMLSLLVVPAQTFAWYNSSANNADPTLNSGAYTFRPNGSYPLPPSGPVALTIAAQVGFCLRARLRPQWHVGEGRASAVARGRGLRATPALPRRAPRAQSSRRCGRLSARGSPRRCVRVCVGGSEEQGSPRRCGVECEGVADSGGPAEQRPLLLPIHRLPPAGAALGKRLRRRLRVDGGPRPLRGRPRTRAPHNVRSTPPCEQRQLADGQQRPRHGPARARQAAGLELHGLRAHRGQLLPSDGRPHGRGARAGARAHGGDGPQPGRRESRRRQPRCVREGREGGKDSRETRLSLCQLA